MSRTLALLLLTLLAGPAAAEERADGDALFRQGRALLAANGDARQALAPLEAALDAFRAAGRDDAAAETLYALAVAQGVANLPEAARASDLQAIEAFRALGDRHGEAAAHDHLAGLLAAAGEVEAARRHFDAALEGRRDDPALRASTLHNLGALLFEVGEFGGALERFEDSLALHRAAGNRAALAAGLNNLGLFWLQMNRPVRAEAALGEALVLHRALGDRRREAGTLDNLGLLAWQRRRFAEARDTFDQAIALYRQVDDQEGLAETLGNQALAELELANRPAARALLDGALALARRHGWRRTLGNHQTLLARLHAAAGRPAEALALFEANAAEQAAIGDPWGESETRHRQALLLRDQGRLDDALFANARAIALAETMRASLSSGHHHSLSSGHHHSLSSGHPHSLSSGHHHSLSSGHHHSLDAGPLRAFFLAGRRHLYDLHIDLLMAAGRAEEALEVAEQARARALLDLLRLAGGKPGDTSPLRLAELSAQLDDETRVLAFHLGAEKAWVWTNEGPAWRGVPLGATAGLEERVRDATTRLQRSHQRTQRGAVQLALQALTAPLLGPLADSTPSRLVVVADGALCHLPFAAMTLLTESPPAEIVHLPSLAALQAWRESPAPAPPPGQVAILADPVFGPDDPRAPKPTPQAEVLDFVAPDASPSPARQVARLTFSALEAQLVSAAWGRDPLPPASPPPQTGKGGEPRNEGQGPSGSPAESESGLPFKDAPSKDASRLSDGADAASKDASHLSDAEDASRLSDSSAGAEGATHTSLGRKPQVGRREPQVGEDPQGVRGLKARTIPTDASRVFTGLDATRDLLLGGSLGGFRRLHIATHAFADDAEPENSGLLLAQLDAHGRPQDGFVRLADLLRLRLPAAELVTLSACRSAGGELDGEGLLGLSHGFFAAGARRLLVSLWEVDDRATAELMGHFYRGLAAGETPARALALAQRRISRDPRWGAPFYWAPFVLIGDWT